MAYHVTVRPKGKRAVRIARGGGTTTRVETAASFSDPLRGHDTLVELMQKTPGVYDHGQVVDSSTGAPAGPYVSDAEAQALPRRTAV